MGIMGQYIDIESALLVYSSHDLFRVLKIVEWEQLESLRLVF